MNNADSVPEEKAVTLTTWYLCQEYALFTLWLLNLLYIACKYRTWLMNTMVYLIVSFTLCFVVQCAQHTVFHQIFEQSGGDPDNNILLWYKGTCVAMMVLPFYQATKFSYGVYLCY